MGGHGEMERVLTPLLHACVPSLVNPRPLRVHGRRAAGALRLNGSSHRRDTAANAAHAAGLAALIPALRRGPAGTCATVAGGSHSVWTALAMTTAMSPGPWAIERNWFAQGP
jgi:hypothetical protein